MQEKLDRLTIYKKKIINQLKFLLLIFLLVGMNGWVFEQKLHVYSKNDLSKTQIPPLSLPRGEEDPETDISTIYCEESIDQTFLMYNKDEGDNPLDDQKTIASSSQSKNASWYYENLTPEDRKKIRLAMDYAIPREQIINDIMNDSAVKIASLIGQHYTGIYDPAIQARDYDKVMALDLLEQVFGYRYDETTDPYFEMTLIAPTSIPARMQWATLIAQMFAEIGIDTELKLWDWDTIMPRIFNDPVGIGYDFFHGGFDAFFIGWTGLQLDTDFTQFYHSDSFVPNGSNYYWLNNSIVDAFLDQAYSAVQLDDRIQALKDFQAWFHDEVPQSMILQFLDFFGVDPLVEGLDPYLVYNGPWMNNVTVGTQTSLTYTVPGDFIDFNPACSYSNNFDKVWSSNVYLSLAERRGMYNSTHPVPLVAEKWESSPDGLEWIVKIRDGIKWDDGSNLTVDDVIYTYHSQFKDETGSSNQYLLQNWFPNSESDIVKVNDSAVKFTLGSFYPFVESQVFGLKILQKSQMETITYWKTDGTNYGTTKLHGCGPYMFKSYNGYDTIELEINPYYNQAIFGHNPNAIGGGVWWPNASIPTAFFKVVYTAEEAVTGLETGLYDIIDPNTGLQSYIDEIEASTWGKIVTFPAARIQELGYNHYSPIWGMNPKDPRTMYPEHDLLVSLETQSSLEINTTALINVTILNYGWTNETDVELQLWIDDTLETTQIYPFMLGSTTETFTYPWTPTELGIYNITAYVVPRINETNIENNTRSSMVTVTDPSKRIGIIFTHGETMSSNLKTYYEGLEYVVDEIYTTITSDVLNNYSYIFVGEGGSNWLESEVISAENYIQNGGIFIGMGDSPPANGTVQLAINHEISFLGYSIGNSGSTTILDPFHPLMDGIFSIYIPGVSNALTVTGSAKPLIWDNTGSGIYGATVDIGTGHLLVLADDFYSNIYDDDNEILFFNILKWLYWQPPDHDLSLTLSTPPVLLPGGTAIINVTIENRGLNNETDVELQLWINSILETSQNYPSFLTGAKETLSYSWTPTIVGDYNVTAYAVPVTNETSLENNIVTDLVIVTDPILNFKIGDYIRLLDFYGWEWIFNYTNYIDDTHVRVELKTSGMIEWYSVNILTGLIEDGYSDYIGYYYFGQIRTDIELGDTINWFSVIGTVVGTVFYEWNGTFLEAWNISIASMDVYNYYHKETGVWLLYHTSGGDIHMVDTSMIICQPPDHELHVSLEVDTFVQRGETTLVNATVYNSGINDETNVELILYLDGVPVSTSGTIASLLADENVSIQYTWDVAAYGTYNFTAYTIPVINETYTLNNIATVIVRVIDPAMRMGFISTHGEYSLSGLMTYYEGLGYVVDTIYSNITYDLLRGYQYIFVGESGGSWTPSEIAALEEYIFNGGIFIGIGDSPPAAGTVQIALNHGITFLGYSVGSSGSTTNVDIFHPLMENVTSIYIPGIYNALEITGFVELILKDNSGTGIYGAAVNIGTGHLLVLADDFGSFINYDDNEQLFLNILQWPSWEPPAHDLVVLLDVPTELRLEGTLTIDTIIWNRGSSNESNVEIQLWINDALVSNHIYPSLLTFTTETFTYLWTPTDYGVYNITAYVVPVTNETRVGNNNKTIITTVQKYLSHTSIYIYSNTLLNSSFPGIGTIDDPIRIEWYNITASSGTLIYIRDTTLYFRITNCFLNGMTSANRGIWLSNVENCIIENNTIFDLSTDGIFTSSSTNLIIANNIVYNNEWNGIYLDSSIYSSIINNTVYNCDDGIRLLLSSNNNTVSNNTCYNNRWVGIRLQNSVHNNTITNNTVYNNSENGILIEGPEASNNNIIKYNTVHSNLYNGIHLTQGSSYNIIANNIVYDNNGGITTWEAGNNIVSNNIVHDNEGAGIGVSNSNDCTILNNTVYGQHPSGGINLDSSSSCIIINNTVFNIQGWAGISLNSGSDDCSVIGNQVYSNNGNGILLDHSNNNDVIKNSAYDNNYPGIRLDTANDNYIFNNSLYLNKESGIWLFNYNYRNEILNNTVFNNGNGIFLLKSNDNIVSKNFVFNNGDGLIIAESDKNIISFNKIIENTRFGISINSLSNNNLIKCIEFYANNAGDTQANDDGSNNVFILNYWNGWISPDIDEDGIVDNPYPIDGSANNVDHCPLVSLETHALTSPELSYPNGGEVLSGIITIQWADSVDSFGHSVTYAVYYSLDSGNSWISLQEEITSTSYEWNTKAVNDGNTYLIRVVATCSEGLTKEDISSQFTIHNEEPTTTTATPTTPSTSTTASTTTTTKKGPGFTGIVIILSILSLIFIKRKK